MADTGVEARPAGFWPRHARWFACPLLAEETGQHIVAAILITSTLGYLAWAWHDRTH